ncbi:MAG: hypothetical protein J07HX5_00520 [halophilic archaeon J07HX5]|nr:MAG: hypothetical protein J07HX5_00520 [halophilic archaeon J07HX5]
MIVVVIVVLVLIFVGLVTLVFIVVFVLILVGLVFLGLDFEHLASVAVNLDLADAAVSRVDEHLIDRATLVLKLDILGGSVDAVGCNINCLILDQLCVGRVRAGDERDCAGTTDEQEDSYRSDD